MSEQVWLPLLRQSGSATLGGGILRLAALAEAAHMQQTAASYHADDASEWRADGSARRDVVAVRLDGSGLTEVDR